MVGELEGGMLKQTDKVRRHAVVHLDVGEGKMPFPLVARCGVKGGWVTKDLREVTCNRCRILMAMDKAKLRRR